MKIVTALGSPRINEKLKEETKFEIIGNDIQYKEGILETLENEIKIDIIIISELLPGEIEIKKLIDKIIEKDKKIEIILILNEKNEEEKNYFISKGIFNIFYNNKITIEELKIIIKEIEKNKKENDINEEIKQIKRMINEKENKKKVKNIIKEKIKKFLHKNKKIKKSKNKIISIVGTNGVGKSIIASLFAKISDDEKILLIDFDIFQQSINSIFNCKKKDKKTQDLIVKVNKKIDLICDVNFLFDKEYKIKKDKIKIFLENISHKYNKIIIDTTSECFFDYTKEILKNSNHIIFLTQSNVVELKKTKKLLNIYINNWSIEKNKINILFNKENKNSTENKILKVLFSEFNILGKINLNNKMDLIINNHLRKIDKKTKNEIKKIVKQI